MGIKATNIIVGGEIKESSPPTKIIKKGSISAANIIVGSEQVVENKPVEKQIKKRVAVEQPQQVTKELPKYVEKEDGLLVRKINTKSSYMRDIFDLDS